MGMYTRITGYLYIEDSYDDKRSFEKEPYENEFEEYKKEFHKIWNGSRAELATSTTCYHIGSDWEHYIMFGGSIKDYDNDLKGWLDFLLTKYKCDGRIEMLYEEWDEPIIYNIENSTFK